MPSKTGRRAKKEKRAKAGKRKTRTSAPSTWSPLHETCLPSRAAEWAALSAFHLNYSAWFLIVAAVAAIMSAIALAYFHFPLPFFPHLYPAGQHLSHLILPCILVSTAGLLLLFIVCFFSSTSELAKGARGAEKIRQTPTQQNDTEHQEQSHIPNNGTIVNDEAQAEDDLEEHQWSNEDEGQGESKCASEADTDDQMQNSRQEQFPARPPWQ